MPEKKDPLGGNTMETIDVSSQTCYKSFIDRICIHDSACLHMLSSIKGQITTIQIYAYAYMLTDGWACGSVFGPFDSLHICRRTVRWIYAITDWWTVTKLYQLIVHRCSSTFADTRLTGFLGCGIVIFEVCVSTKWHNLQVDEHNNALSEFVDLNDTL